MQYALFFNLLATLTKHLPLLGPTCPKLLPGNDHPHPPQSPWVQSGLPSSREAHLSTAPPPTLVRLPLQVLAAEISTQRSGGEVKQNETVHMPFPQPSLLSSHLSSCECILIINKKCVAMICPPTPHPGLLGLC